MLKICKVQTFGISYKLYYYKILDMVCIFYNCFHLIFYTASFISGRYKCLNNEVNCFFFNTSKSISTKNDKLYIVQIYIYMLISYLQMRICVICAYM